MPRLPDHLIEEIRGANDIVALISEYVPLKRAGRSYKTLCPFHSEKTPSFVVNPERQIYHCFGCGTGGNVITFVMEQDKVGFFEAIQVLAKRAGIDLPRVERDSRRTEENDLFFAANEFAASFYQRALDNEEGRVARAYLQSRGIASETARAFRLGFAPDRWDALLIAAKRSALSPRILERAGLLLEREDRSGYYDRFRGRVIFPILNLTGQVVGFGGRSLSEGERDAKYLNSPETPIYQKGKSLYGLYQAKGQIRAQEQSIVVEGYLDLLTAHQAGWTNVVATLGTALTIEQARLLSRYATETVLVYDPDAPGTKAALRGVEVMLEAGLDVRVVTLPAGLDPDALIRTRGTEAFRDAVQGSQDFFDYKLDALAGTLDLREVSGRSRAVEELLALLRRVKGELKQRLFVQRVAERFGLGEDLLLRLLTGGGSRTPSGKAQPDAAGTTASREKTEARVRLERGLLRLIARDPALVRRACEALDPRCLQDETCRAAAELLFAACSSDLGLDPARLLGDVPSGPVRGMLSEILVQEEESRRDTAKELDEYIASLQRAQTGRALRNLKAQIQAAETRGDLDALSRLQREYYRLSTRPRPSPGA
jgi:DNA primase